MTRTPISLEELMDGYRAQYRADKDYMNSESWKEYVLAIEYLMKGTYEIHPFRDDDGKCDYRLRVRS
jgi:hypothetical protein